MGYGLKVENESGGLQIDSLYTNWCLYEHGESVTTVDDGNGWYKKTVTFSSATAIPPLIAIKPSSSKYCGLYRYTISGSNFTGFIVGSENNNAATIDWMAFVPQTAKTSETHGLRVYDASSTLVFDGGRNPLIIMDVDTANPAYSAVQTITHPSDANAYFIMAPHGWWQYITTIAPNLSGGVNYWPMFKYLTATTVSFGGVSGDEFQFPSEVEFSDGHWPATWTILTVKKAF